MEELRLFFDALRDGNENPVEVVRSALKRRREAISVLQKEAMLSKDECDRRLSELHKLTLLSDKIDKLEEELRRCSFRQHT